MADRHAEGQSKLALRFFFVSAVAFLAAAAITFTLIEVVGSLLGTDYRAYPRAFAASTCFLLAGSLFLQRALRCVRRERQLAFRRSLKYALAAGTLFVGVQGFGLWSLLRNQDLREAQTGVAAFVFVFTVMHAMHFAISLLFLLNVTIRALADRYDHEYHWGVLVAAYFWHVLGVVWLAILGVFVIAT